jgi:DNA invertase Pin-like site-specific DNA recombinase
MVVALRYRRVSGIGQEDNTSLEKQLDRIDEYCITRGYESAPEYLFTEVMTAVETWRERPELQKLLRYAEELAKETEVVVVVDHPDRFARGMDLVLLVELLSYYGVRVSLCKQSLKIPMKAI